jgi:integrase
VLGSSPAAIGGFDPWAETAPFPATTRFGTAVLDRPRFLTPGRHRGPAPEPARATDPYNLWVITTTAEALAASLPNTAATLDLPAGLTVDDALRIAEAVASTLAESTRHVYGHGWRRWERWCCARQTSALPASPAMICAYLTERASEGALIPTLDLAIGAISYAHRSRGLDDPTLSEAVRQVRRGLRRIVGTAPRRQARPLDTGDIRQMLGPIDRTTAKGARDATIILLGFASALRRSELAALDLADVEPKPGGLLLHVRRSKTDQDAAGQVVAVAHGQHAETDPIAALDGWLGQRGHEPGPLFTSMRNKTITTERLSGNAIARMLRNRADRAGLPAERITPHSLRAGHATTAAIAGVSLDRIAAQTRHKRLSTLLERYIRPAQALDFTSSRDLGL